MQRGGTGDGVILIHSTHRWGTYSATRAQGTAGFTCNLQTRKMKSGEVTSTGYDDNKSC